MNRIYILFFTAITLLTASCADLLNISPEDQISSETMWTTPDLALKGMNGIYEVFYSRDLSSVKVSSSALDGYNKYGIEGLGFCTDYYSNGVFLELLTYQAKRASDTQVSYEWKFCYTIIHACNDAIANLHKAGLDEETYERYQCEARFLRAWAYQRLNKLYHGVPIYLEPISNEECTRTQSTEDEVWDVIIDDCTYCINNEYCPNETLTSSHYGRPSKGAAYALRGMSYMWMEEWRKAADDFEKVGQCGYGLFTTGEYSDIFLEENENCGEMIFTIQFDEETGYSDNIEQSFGARDSYDGWDECKPAADFVDYYQNADGTTFVWSEVPGLEDWDSMTNKQHGVFFLRDGLISNPDYSTILEEAIELCGEDVFYNYYLDEGNEDRIKVAYADRDPRLGQTCVVPYEPIDTYTPAYNDGEMMYGKQFRWPLYERGRDEGDLWLDQRTGGFYMYKKYVKFIKNELIDRSHCFTDYPLIRYTDVWLQWAEALIELGEYSSAADMINTIRTRAHMPDITVGSADEMRNAVRYERRVELCAEAVNFFDEMRWKTYRETKFKNLDVHGGQTWWGDDDIVGNWYWDDCLYCWPVPQTEYQRNPNLVPTPGYVY